MKNFLVEDYGAVSVIDTYSEVPYGKKIGLLRARKG